MTQGSADKGKESQVCTWHMDIIRASPLPSRSCYICENSRFGAQCTLTCTHNSQTANNAIAFLQQLALHQYCVAATPLTRLDSLLVHSTARHITTTHRKVWSHIDMECNHSAADAYPEEHDAADYHRHSLHCVAHTECDCADAQVQHHIGQLQGRME